MAIEFMNTDTFVIDFRSPEQRRFDALSERVDVLSEARKAADKHVRLTLCSIADLQERIFELEKPETELPEATPELMQADINMLIYAIDCRLASLERRGNMSSHEMWGNIKRSLERMIAQ